MATIFDVPIEEIGVRELDSFLAAQLPEAERHEYKSRWDSARVGEAICAFANAVGGILLVGVTDGNEQPPYAPIGIEAHERTLWEDQARSIASSIVPPVRIEATAIEVESGKVVVMVRVPPSPARPHAYRDRVFIRMGHETRHASFSLIEQLILSRNAARSGDTTLGRLKSGLAHYANAYRLVLVADSYAEAPIFVDLETDALLEAAANATLTGGGSGSRRPRGVHVTRTGVPLGNDLH